MKISVDTKEDSKEDIRKLVAFLSTLDGKDSPEVSMNAENFGGIAPSPAVAQEQPYVDMFASNDTPQQMQAPEDKPSTVTADSGFVNIFADDRPKDPEPPASDQTADGGFVNIFADNTPSAADDRPKDPEPPESDQTADNGYVNIFADNTPSPTAGEELSSQNVESPPTFDEEPSQEEKELADKMMIYD